MPETEHGDARIASRMLNAMNVDSVPGDNRLDLLLDRWEEGLSSGNERPSIDELCRDCPELKADFAAAIERLKRLEHFLFPERNQTPIGPAYETLLDIPSKVPQIPGYDILSEIGRGGMGIVYKARQNSLKRVVAIKMLRRPESGNSTYAARLRWEAQGLSMLDHPNIVKILDVIETSDASVAIVLEYIAGETLADKLKVKPMTPRESAEMTGVLARTMSFVHEVGLLHRDIKPSNVLIDPAGRIKLVDFGLVKEARFAPTTKTKTDSPEIDHSALLQEGSFSREARVQLTRYGEYFGTPSYMSPEQTPGGNGEVGVQSDIYSIGATLYEMLTGVPPFVGKSPAEIHRKVQQELPAFPRQLNPRIPLDLETICLKCLSKNSAHRFESARQLVDELERFQQGIPIKSRRVGVLEVLKMWCFRRPAVALLLATLSIATCAIIGLLLKNNQSLVRHSRELEQFNRDLKELVGQRDKFISESERSKRLAELRADEAKEALYIQAMNQAGLALQRGDTRELTRLLDKQIPKQEEDDRRGFEWWHLYRRLHPPGKTLLKTPSPQYFIAPRPGTHQIVVAGADSTIRCLDRRNGKFKYSIATGQIEINHMAFWPEREEVVTSGDDGTVRIWKIKEKTQKLRWQAFAGKAYQVYYAMGGTKLVTCGEDPEIRVFDALTGELSFTLSGHQNAVQSLICDDDGDTLISASDDRTIRIWSLQNRKQTEYFEHSAKIGQLAFDSGRKLLFFGCTDGEIKSASLISKSVISTVKHFEKIGALAVNPQSTILAAGDASGRISLRRIDQEGRIVKGQDRSWLAHQGMVYSLSWTADGKAINSTGKDGQLFLWQIESGAAAEPRSVSFDGLGSTFSIVPETTTFTIKAHNQFVCHDWKKNTSRSLRTCPVPLYEPVLSPNGEFCAAVTGDASEVHLFPRGENGHEYADDILGWRFSQFRHPQASIGRLRFSPDSKSLAFTTQPWSLENGLEKPTVCIVKSFKARPTEMPFPDSSGVNFQAELIPLSSVGVFEFLPDGKRMCLVNDKLIMWDLSNRKIIWDYSNPSAGDIREITINADGSLIAIARNRQILVLGADDRSVRFESALHRAPVSSIAFSPDSRIIASGSDDGIIKFWHIATGEELIEFENPTGGIVNLGFVERGRQLLVHLSPKGHLNTPDQILIYDASPIDP